jgi:glycosyltransferase involved in cell wall biosynthesis
MVTVAMSVHNGAGTLGSAIRSILWQTFSDWELLLVNDASTDETGEIVRKFPDSRIRVIDERERKGLATRLNQCVDLARGKYVARMDADDVAYPERFKRQVEYLEGHHDVDLLGHGAVLFKGDGEVLGVYPAVCDHDEICRRPWWGFPLAHPTWMGKQSWFAAHPYSEQLAKGQDQELLLRSFRTSRFAVLPDILLGYRMERISVTKSASGRLAYCRGLLAQVHDLPSSLNAVRGITVHGVALARDLVLDLTGTMSQDVRQSFGSADDTIKNGWRAVWNRLPAEQEHRI